ncbi:MAG: hypothetical protein ISEC1_P0913 [Thiomicrorhabdus sp.]|nr:MAG: hypothetical protein ISEC1_P0913 [Thiomicrorhabdus sp.]
MRDHTPSISNFSLKPLRALLPTFILLFMALSTQVSANNDVIKKPQGNQVHFSISESEQINNNIVSVSFRKQTQASSAQSVTREINIAMADAVALLKKYPDITPQTSQYNIRPVYNKNRVISHWMGSQTLTITFNNQPKLLAALTELQALLSYQSMQFSVSAANRQTALNKLMLKAIKHFQQQADIIAQSFSSAQYKILETRINMPSPSPFRQGPPPARMMMAESTSAPAVEAGKSRLQVQISGILLLPY